MSKASKKFANGSKSSPREGKLKIELSETGIVTLCVSDNPDAWAQARLIILERTIHARLTGGDRLEVPWWEFAGLLPQLRTLTQLFPGLNVEADQKTRSLIAQSNEAIDRLDALSPNSSVSEGELKSALHKLNFGPDRELKKHQIANIRRLAVLPNGATFSVPGAGKTTEALATFAFKTRLKSRLLVVCPKNAFAAWEEQVAACLPWFSVTRLTGGRTRIAKLLNELPKIAVITYSQLVNVVDLVQKHLAEHPIVVFLDESHKIKGEEHKPWPRSVLSISHLPQWKLIMSGTPMPNTVGDLIPQIRFLYPNLGSVFDPVSTIKRFFVRTTKAQLNLPPVESKGIGQETMTVLLRSR